MLKKFKDFDVEQYRVKHILESLEEKNSEIEFDESLLDTPISANKYLLKISKIIMKTLRKNGIEDYAPYGTVVYVNGVPGVWFSKDGDESKSIIACRNQYDKFIAVFNNFKIGGENKAIVTYSSSQIGIKDMIEQAVDDLKDDEINESLLNEAFRAAAGYGEGHVKKVAAWSEAMKEFCVNALSSGMTPGKLATEILKNISSNPICADIYESFNKKDSTIKYATNIIFDAMNKTYPELDGLLEGKLAASKPSLTKTIDVDYDVEAYEAEKEEKRKIELEKEQKKFEESMDMIADIVDTFCHYVKQNGQLDEDDESVFTTRGLYVTGRAGSGKSYTVKQVLKKNNMVEKKDYINVGNGATNADALYRLMYKWNGKLVILDDAANVVGGSTRIAFWKQLLQTDPETVKNPRETREDSNQYYEVNKKSRQERYFAEIGQKSNDEKNEFFKKRRKELASKDVSSKELDNTIANEWNDLKKTVRPLIPDEFLFTGCVVVIGNMTPEELEKSVVQSGGKRDWDAIRQRFQPVELNPPYEVMWSVIQETIRKQQAKSEDELPSYCCSVPREYVDEFIDEVNHLLSGEEGDRYTEISWRVVNQIGKALKGDKGRRHWKRLLREKMIATS